MTLTREDNTDEAVYAIEDYLADINTRMENNLLNLNQLKTKLILFSFQVEY